MKFGKAKTAIPSDVFSNDQDPVQSPKKKIEVKLTVILLRILVAIALCAAVPLFDVYAPYSVLLFLAAGLIVGLELLLSGIYSLLHEDYFNRDSLLLLVFVVAFIVGFGYEGALLLIIARISDLLNDYITRRNGEQVVAMTGLEFDTAKVYADEQITEKFLDEVQPGDEIIVAAGEYIPLDCIVIDGKSTTDARLIDGVSNPVESGAGAKLLAGTLNMTGDLHCEVTSEGSTTASDILKVLEKEDRLTVPDIIRLFQPIMVVFSVLVGLVLVWTTDVDAFEAVHRSLALVALSSAIPAFMGVPDIRFASRAGAASRGVVFATDKAFRNVANCQSIVFDAEGTLTAGKQQVQQVRSNKLDSETMLKIAAHAMAYAQGAEAEALQDAYQDEIQFELIDDFKEIPNVGVEVVFNGIPVKIGPKAMMTGVAGFVPENVHVDQQTLYMSVSNLYAGCFILSDPIRTSASVLAGDMVAFGLENVEFVTSYTAETAEKISESSGIMKYASNCGSDARLEYVEQVRESTSGKLAYMYSEKQKPDYHSLADTDICVGGKPNELLLGKCDVVIPGGRPAAFSSGMTAARQADRLCKMAVYFVFAVKLILVVMAAIGSIPVWFAATLECIASLFTKVFASSAFHEKPGSIFGRLGSKTP